MPAQDSADVTPEALINRLKRGVVYISETGDLRSQPILEREAIEPHLNLARNPHIEARIPQEQNPAGALMDFARRERIMTFGSHG
jgi:hypothetical protein